MGTPGGDHECVACSERQGFTLDADAAAAFDAVEHCPVRTAVSAAAKGRWQQLHERANAGHGVAATGRVDELHLVAVHCMRLTVASQLLQCLARACIGI